MGAVHTRIHVLQHRPIPRDARVEYPVAFRPPAC